VRGVAELWMNHKEKGSEMRGGERADCIVDIKGEQMCLLGMPKLSREKRTHTSIGRVLVEADWIGKRWTCAIVGRN